MAACCKSQRDRKGSEEEGTRDEPDHFARRYFSAGRYAKSIL